MAWRQLRNETDWGAIGGDGGAFRGQRWGERRPAEAMKLGRASEAEGEKSITGEGQSRTVPELGGSLERWGLVSTVKPGSEVILTRAGGPANGGGSGRVAAPVVGGLNALQETFPPEHLFPPCGMIFSLSTFVCFYFIPAAAIV